MSRPRGQVRIAIASALEQGPGTIKEIARRSCVGQAVASRTIWNMLMSGQLVRVGLAKERGTCRPVLVVGLPDEPRRAPAEALLDAMRAWARVSVNEVSG